MKYESEVKNICGEDWKSNDEEIDGGLGVAIVKAYINGAKPGLNDISRHLGVTPEEISRPYSRLVRNGVLGREETWNVKSDRIFYEDTDDYYRIWGFIAAVAGGLLGKI